MKNHIPKCTGVSNILECPFCHRIFTRYQSKSKHLKICKIKKQQDNAQIEQQTQQQPQQQLQQQPLELKQIVEALQKMQAKYIIILPRCVLSSDYYDVHNR